VQIVSAGVHLPIVIGRRSRGGCLPALPDRPCRRAARWSARAGLPRGRRLSSSAGGCRPPGSGVATGAVPRDRAPSGGLRRTKGSGSCGDGRRLKVPGVADEDRHADRLQQYHRVRELRACCLGFAWRGGMRRS
jgi:hypothetical protein